MERIVYHWQGTDKIADLVRIGVDLEQQAFDELAQFPRMAEEHLAGPRRSGQHTHAHGFCCLEQLKRRTPLQNVLSSRCWGNDKSKGKHGRNGSGKNPEGPERKQREDGIKRAIRKMS